MDYYAYHIECIVANELFKKKDVALVRWERKLVQGVFGGIELPGCVLFARRLRSIADGDT